mgnify:CR=1 FL=1
MNKLFLILVLIGIVIVVTSFSLFATPSETHTPLYVPGFTFYDVEKIQSELSLQNISLSAPTAITDHTVKQYCTYFGNNELKTVEYCTTSVILDSDGRSIGNVNMGGTTDGPIMALAILDTDDLFSENYVDIVFQIMIQTLVCDCWNDQKPGNFESVAAWIDAAKSKFIESPQSTLTSKINGLGGMNLVLEITAKDDSYLWTLIILK